MVELEDSVESLSIRQPKSKVDSQRIVQSIAYGFRSRCLRKICTWKQFLSLGRWQDWGGVQDFDRANTARNNVMFAFNFSLSVFIYTEEEPTWAEKVDCFHSIASILNWLPSSSFDSSIMFHAPSAHSTVCERDSGRLYNFLLYIGPQCEYFSREWWALGFYVWQNGVLFTSR